METKVFDRIEKKYLITSSQKKQILKTINKHMEKDGYFRSEVLNLYFDNDNYDLIIQSIDRQEGDSAAAAKSLQSCLTLCNTTDGSPRGSQLWRLRPGFSRN